MIVSFAFYFLNYNVWPPVMDFTVCLDGKVPQQFNLLIKQTQFGFTRIDVQHQAVMRRRSSVSLIRQESMSLNQNER